MDSRVRTGRVSDVIEGGLRTDWSWAKNEIEKLRSIDMVSIERPLGISMSRFRSTLLMIGRRAHRGEWRMRTRTRGDRVECYLVGGV